MVSTKEFLQGVGLEKVSEETIIRYEDMLKGINHRMEGKDEILSGVFPEHYEGIIIEPDIPIYSFCEHHILPWFGTVHIGYIAHGKVLGISKFTRIVKYLSGGLTIQERVCGGMADLISDIIETEDVIVFIQALHTCKVARGVFNPFSRTITIDARGAFREKEGPRIEFFNSLMINAK